METMNIQDILFQIMGAHTWVSYFKDDSTNSLPNEYVTIRTRFLDGNKLLLLTNVGFVIDRITSEKINQDAYAEIHLKRKLNY